MMPILFNHPICPLSRQVRIYLKELNIQFNALQENYWLQRQEFLKINPSGTLPVLATSPKLNLTNESQHDLGESGLLAGSKIDAANSLAHLKMRNNIADMKELHNDTPIYILGIYPITEYLIEQNENFYFMPKDLAVRSQIRHYILWFNDKFYREITKVIVDEKMIRLLMRAGVPRSNFIKIAKNNLNHHLKFLSNLLDKNLYITSEQISCADIAAACNISVLDYFGEINWDNWPQIKHWYAIIKSRPSFRPILQDQIAGFPPSKEYTNLDF